MKKVLMSGNEAIARGVYEAGVRFAAAYPGTPSTEIMEQFARYDGVYAEWAPNEKVAVEVAIGAALGGAKALAVMKHVGVNVAADPIFTVSYTGIAGALVIISADDPSMHSSQNEQDNRNYAKFAKIPMLEPSDPQEAKEYVKLAFALSEQFDTPVFLRTTTRVSHSKSVVTIDELQIPEDKTTLARDASKYV
ncbi:MAG: thiamine pyrophosphate-binding protein, partial [Smithellaceae bacterium]|nr:thiamine pyrophosphate-binding protein [Smithellaceae bacterium]